MNKRNYPPSRQDNIKQGMFLGLILVIVILIVEYFKYTFSN